MSGGLQVFSPENYTLVFTVFPQSNCVFQPVAVNKDIKY